MDPEEEGGEPPPRRSRRLQQLDPTSPRQNDETMTTIPYIDPEDASYSQYGLGYPIEPTPFPPMATYRDRSTLQSSQDPPLP